MNTRFLDQSGPNQKDNIYTSKLNKRKEFHDVKFEIIVRLLRWVVGEMGSGPLLPI